MWIATFVRRTERNALQTPVHPPMMTVGFEADNPADALIVGINMLKDLLRSTEDWTLHALTRS